MSTPNVLIPVSLQYVLKLKKLGSSNFAFHSEVVLWRLRSYLSLMEHLPCVWKTLTLTLSTEKSFGHCDASNFVLQVKTLLPIFTTKAAGFWQSALNLQVSLHCHLNIFQTVNLRHCPCLFFLLSFLPCHLWFSMYKSGISFIKMFLDKFFFLILLHMKLLGVICFCYSVFHFPDWATLNSLCIPDWPQTRDALPECKTVSVCHRS